MQINIADTAQPGELKALYESVGWTAYITEPESLSSAVANSTFVVTARQSGVLVGLARGLSDDVSIFYLQDILIHPDHQRQGIGRALLNECLDRFDHVRTKVLLTDDHPAQHRIYESMGYRNTRDEGDDELHAFVR